MDLIPYIFNFFTVIDIIKKTKLLTKEFFIETGTKNIRGPCGIGDVGSLVSL